MTVLRRLCTLVLGIALPILSINLALADDRVVSDEMRQAQSILIICNATDTGSNLILDLYFAYLVLF